MFGWDNADDIYTGTEFKCSCCKIPPFPAERIWTIAAIFLRTCSVSPGRPVNDIYIFVFSTEEWSLFFKDIWASRNPKLPLEIKTNFSPFMNGSTGAPRNRVQNVRVYVSQHYVSQRRGRLDVSAESRSILPRCIEITLRFST